MTSVGARLREIRSGYAVAVLVFVLGIGGHAALDALVGPPRQSFVLPPPGSVARFCFAVDVDDQSCPPAADIPAIPVDAEAIWFSYDAPVEAHAHVIVTFWRVDGSDERAVFVVDYGDIGDEPFPSFGPQGMAPSSVTGRPGTYDARATVGGVLVAQGLFTLVSR